MNNDVFGLAASGTNGGQSGIPPLSMEAISQLQVMVSPFDVSQGNFTGGTINSVTRSGNNQKKMAIYHFTSSPGWVGRLPVDSLSEEPSLTSFTRKTMGFSLSGPVTKNKIFYYLNGEWQKDVYPQTFSFDRYVGNTKNNQLLQILTNTLKGTYQYDPGSFWESREIIKADRLISRIDWNLSASHKMSIALRYTHAYRLHSNPGKSNTVHFSNDGYQLDNKTLSVAVELKSRLSRQSANKLAISFTDIADNRYPMGKKFPRLTIYDGNGTIYLGSDISSTTNQLAQKNITLFNKLTLLKGNHTISAGVDAAISIISNAFIQQSYGKYAYYSLADFLTNAAPSAYQLGYSMVDEKIDETTNASARFSFLNAAIFIQDEMVKKRQFSVQLGLRLDLHSFLNNPARDSTLTQNVLPILSGYWDIQGAASGQKPVFPLAISPRLGFSWRLPRLKMKVSGGIGIFTGRMPLVWPGGTYANNGLQVGGFQATDKQLSQIRFRANPYQQWKPANWGIAPNNQPLDIVSARLHMPSLIRSSLQVEKKMGNILTFLGEATFSRNLQEIRYTNVNLMPPLDTVLGPDNRLVYTDKLEGKIPVNPDGSNPYDFVVLLSNQKNPSGYAYGFTADLSLKKKDFSGGFRYQFGQSFVAHEGTNAVNFNQWRMMESVGGRNHLSLSVSDFSPGHQLAFRVNKSFYKKGGNRRISISLFYSGQSGSPFSYVYGGKSLVRDDGKLGGYELIYIPGEAELAQMTFLPFTTNGVTYLPENQREALENYLTNTAYLRDNRGKYAQRNGSRTPFVHRMDVRLQKEFILLIGKTKYTLQGSIDLYNLLNLVNNQWCHQYYVPFNNYQLLDFAGFVSASEMKPQYQFDPQKLNSPPWITSNGPNPAFRSSWTALLGFRLSW